MHEAHAHSVLCCYIHLLLHAQQAASSAPPSQLRAIDTSSSKYPSSVATATTAAVTAADSLSDDSEALHLLTENSDLPDDVIKRLPRPTPADAPPPQVCVITTVSCLTV